MQNDERKEYNHYIKPAELPRNTPMAGALITILAGLLIGVAGWAFSILADTRRDLDRTIERQISVIKINQDQEVEIREIEKRVRNLEYWIRPPEKDGRP